MKFLIDSMLGKLAKWLRIMGYDTYYQKKYRLNELYNLLKHNRIFLSRDIKLVKKFDGILINSEILDNQIKELKQKLILKPNPKLWFSRCVICNTELLTADFEYTKEHVPEYILMQNYRVKFCPTCKRLYWPGTHKQKMIKKLKEWGF